MTNDAGLTHATLREAALRKVPEITVAFWITKVLTTGMGESTSDYLVQNFDPVISVLCAAVAFGVVMILQLRVKKYIAAVYWLAVVMVSVFGTMCADVVHIVIGIPYWVSTIFFGIVLAVIFVWWRRSQGTLSIHSITTRPRELFYWATVLATFALGTAAGDLTATTLQLGYLGSGILFAVIIAIPAIGWWKFKLNAIFAFWFAYVVTRPLGASFADWMAVSPERGGLGWGAGPVSIALSVLIVCFVAYLGVSRSRADRKLALQA
ncbi:MAG TPA: hypothetical protein VGI56_05465 [Galbitalea sp.]